MSGELDLTDLTGDAFDTVVLALPDLQGRLAGKRMSPEFFRSRVEEGMHLCTCALAWDLEQNLGMEFAFAGNHTGWHDFLVIPDLSTLRVAAWGDRTAICIGDAVDEHTRDPLEIAPRSILQRQVALLADRGMTARVASELEFFLYRETYDEARDKGYSGLQPTSRRHVNFSIQHGEAYEPFFRDLRRVAAASALPVEYTEAEYGLGQWEINLQHADSLDMADRHALFKLAVKATAARHGLAATFMPRPYADDLGSSCHLHVSLRDTDGTPLFHDPTGERGTSQLMRHATGGILAHMPDLMLWWAPTINSYRRTASEEFAGGGVSWGYDNRTTSVRMLGTGPSSMRLEFRVPGADVNPHLAAAGLLAMMQSGIDDEADPGQAVVGNAYERRDLTSLPADLREAAGAFDRSAFVSKALGDAVRDHYVELARYEADAFARAVTDWERERYFESI